MKLLLILLSLSFNLKAQIFCDDIDELPIQIEGRIKPFKVAAFETLKFLTHEKKPFGDSMTKAFCKLSLQSLGLHQELDLKIKVEHIELKKLISMNENDSQILASDLEDKKLDIRMKGVAIKENNSLKKEINKVLYRMKIYEQLINGELWTYIERVELERPVWAPISNLNQENFQEKMKYHLKFSESYLDNTHKLELKYFNYKLFSWALLFCLLSIAGLVLFKTSKVGVFIVSLAIGSQITAIVLRVLISKRAPITNMYETVMFSGFGALIIALVLSISKKDKIFLIGGLAYNTLCLMMMNFANNMLDPAIKPLVPVLRDNFWLSTHVTTIILSYAALALSWMLANIVLLKSMFKDEINFKREVKIIYTAIQVGVVSLALGIILGGVWADYSWGRFWGWDPKETWSLIVLLIYMAILHGKYTSWINDKNFVPFVAGAFLSVMMAWFGVNYILASGLHSYGFSEGGAIFLGVFFLVQILIIIASIFLKNKSQKIKA